ncbi:MAG: Hsp33 family molecular chaperone HslO [Gammaproteobacteria bacterium]|jgi:molecular chaperone Hsp33|nr:Hsp33 family molecular chaperone HslO [Gammaproteobacteria bacterium]
MKITTKEPNTDRLHRFTFENLPIRGQWVRLTQTVAAANAVRSYPTEINHLLSQMFAAAALFADNLKFEGAVALQSRGQGKLIRTLAECREQKFLRGIAHLSEDKPAPKQADNLCAWFENGQLALSLVPPEGSQQAPYQGFVPLEQPTLALNLETYLKNSEQISSRLFLANTDESVTGLIIQRLPSKDGATEINAAADEEAWHTIVTLAETISDTELVTLEPSELLIRLFAEFPCRIHPPRELGYKCTCSRDKSDRTLRMLAPAEIKSLLDELGSIDVDCEFCGTRYSYDAVDVDQLHRTHANAPDNGPVQ